MTRASPVEPPTIYATSRRYLSTAIEGLWLLALIIVPLVFVKPDFMDHSHMLPKVVAYRALVGLMAVLWLCEMALGFAGASLAPPREWLARAVNWLRHSPIRWLVVAAAVALLVHLISTLASPLTHLSLFGSEPGIDGSSFYNEAAHFVLFLVIALRVRNCPQIARLLGAVVGTGLVVALYAILQHYTADPFGVITAPGVRVIGPMQNPIFLAAYLMMILPLALVLATLTTKGSRNWALATGWCLAITTLTMALILTASRGSWVSLVVGLVVLSGLATFIAGWRGVVRGGAFLFVSIGIALLVIFVFPGAERVSVQAPGSTEIAIQGATAPHAVAQATGLARGELGQDPSYKTRVHLLDKSWELIAQRPWFAFEGQVPAARFHLLGYGPEMYGQVLPLVTEQAYDADPFALHAHNELLQRWVEQGILGLVSYLILLVAVTFCGLVLLFRWLKDRPVEYRLIAAALLVGAGARTAEQMVGIGRVTDMMLWWTFLGLLVALPTLSRAPAPEAEPEHRQTTPHAGKLATGLLVALVLSVGLLILTWSRNYPYLAAAVDSSAAKTALERDDLATALRRIQNATIEAPDVARYYLAKSEVLDAFFDYPLYEAEYRNVALEIYAADVQAQIRGGYAIYPRLKKARSAERLANLEDETDETKVEEALEEYRRLTQTIPDFWYFYFALAAKYYEFGREDEALQVIPEALKLTGESARASSVYYLQGLVFLEQDALEDAEAAFTKGLIWKDELTDKGAGLQKALDGVLAEIEERKTAPPS